MGMLRGVVAIGIALGLAACAAPRPVPSSGPAPPPSVRLVGLGEQIVTDHGKVFVVRVQDEFRLIRCIPDGPIAGCYEDVLSVAGRDVEWNRWVDVERIPGLRIAFVSPDDVAVGEVVRTRTEPAAISEPAAPGLESPVMAR